MTLKGMWKLHGETNYFVVYYHNFSVCKQELNTFLDFIPQVLPERNFYSSVLIPNDEILLI